MPSGPVPYWYFYVQGLGADMFWVVDTSVTFGGELNGTITFNYTQWPEPPVPPDPTGSIPEPSSLALLGIGLVGLIGYGLKHKKK